MTVLGLPVQWQANAIMQRLVTNSMIAKIMFYYTWYLWLCMPRNCMVLLFMCGWFAILSCFVAVQPDNAALFSTLETHPPEHYIGHL